MNSSERSKESILKEIEKQAEEFKVLANLILSGLEVTDITEHDIRVGRMLLNNCDRVMGETLKTLKGEEEV